MQRGVSFDKKSVQAEFRPNTTNVERRPTKDMTI